MDKQKNNRTEIAPLLESDERPLWSVMIPTFNCSNYLRETLISVLEQAPDSNFMQIEVVDDCSNKDDPKAVVEEIGKGRIEFYQQPENKGYLRNFDTCLQRARGKFVHLLHGDDLILHGFYQKMQNAFDKNPEIGAAVCRHVYIDGKGNWKFISPLEEIESQIYSDWVEQIAIYHRIQPPSIVVKREVYEKLGGFDHSLCCACEDWEMWSRIASNYPVWYEVEPLAMYRQVEGKSLTNRCIRTGKNINDYLTAIYIIKDYIPQERSEASLKTMLENNSFTLLCISSDFLWIGEIKTAFLQAKGALRSTLSIKALVKFAFFFFKKAIS